MGTAKVDLEFLRPFFKVDQIAMVVTDAERAAHYYVDQLGIGPWNITSMGPEICSTMRVHGVETPFRFRAALARGQLVLELIQPLDDSGVFADALGFNGLHHIGTYVSDASDLHQKLLQAGVPCIAEGYGFGADSTGSFAIFDTRPWLGTNIELVVAPGKRRAPDLVVDRQPVDKRERRVQNDA